MNLRTPLLLASVLAVFAGGYTLADDDDHEGKDRYRRPKGLGMPADAPQIWKDECGSCHMLYLPGLLPPAAWQLQMDTLAEHYGSNASLETAEYQEILDFLLRNSTRNRLPVESRGRPGEPPRVSETRWFEDKHDEVSTEKFQRESVGGPANCVACHRDAERGDFDDDRVKIPR